MRHVGAARLKSAIHNGVGCWQRRRQRRLAHTHTHTYNRTHDGLSARSQFQNTKHTHIEIFWALLLVRQRQQRVDATPARHVPIPFRFCFYSRTPDAVSASVVVDCAASVSSRSWPTPGQHFKRFNLARSRLVVVVESPAAHICCHIVVIVSRYICKCICKS